MLIRICDICGEETGKEYYDVTIDAAAKCFDKNNIHYSLCKKCKNKVNKYIHYERLLHKENKKANKSIERSKRLSKTFGGLAAGGWGVCIILILVLCL